MSEHSPPSLDAPVHLSGASLPHDSPVHDKAQKLTLFNSTLCLDSLARSCSISSFEGPDRAFFAFDSSPTRTSARYKTSMIQTTMPLHRSGLTFFAPFMENIHRSLPLSFRGLGKHILRSQTQERNGAQIRVLLQHKILEGRGTASNIRCRLGWRSFNELTQVPRAKMIFLNHMSILLPYL